jgi:hypothetical protein
VTATDTYEGHPSLAAALAAFQRHLPRVGKDNTANVRSDKGAYTYRYADLSEISPVVLPALAQQGLSWSTWPSVVDGRFVLTYRLAHESGDDLSGDYPLPQPGSSPQILGSAITYARRYCLCAVTGVAPGGDDDDAAEAQQGPPAEQPPANRPARDLLRADCLKNGWSQPRVAALYAESNAGADLRTASTAQIEAFRRSLYSRPEAELRGEAAAL